MKLPRYLLLLALLDASSVDGQCLGFYNWYTSLCHSVSGSTNYLCYGEESESAAREACLTRGISQCSVGVYIADPNDGGGWQCRKGAYGVGPPSHQVDASFSSRRRRTYNCSRLTCQTCPHGLIRDESMMGCKPCPPAMEVSLGSTECTGCATGKHWSLLPEPIVLFGNRTSIGTCAECPAGKYTARIGQISCTNCSTGRSNPYKGQGSAGACLACDPGKYGRTAGLPTCASCMEGEYTPSIGYAEPVKCRPGTWNSALESSSSSACVPCASGRYSALAGQVSAEACGPCQPGRKSDPGSRECSLCVPGTFASSHASQFCAQCPPGRYGSLTASVSIDNCQECPAGSYQVHTPNVMATSLLSCLPCPAGTYNDISGQDDQAACKACPSGTSSDLYSSSRSQCLESAATSCPPGSQNVFTSSGSKDCVDCAAGKYSPSATTDCSDCPTDTYSESPGSTACVGCPYATSSLASSTKRDQCKACLEGFYISENGCVPCLAGTYNEQTGATSCKTCPSGHTCNVASSVPVPSSSFTNVFGQFPDLNRRSSTGHDSLVVRVSGQYPSTDMAEAETSDAERVQVIILAVAAITATLLVVILPKVLPAKVLKHLDSNRLNHNLQDGAMQKSYSTVFGGAMTIGFLIMAAGVLVSQITMYTSCNFWIGQGVSMIEVSDKIATIVDLYVTAATVNAKYCSYKNTRISVQNIHGQAGFIGLNGLPVQFEHSASTLSAGICQVHVWSTESIMLVAKTSLKIQLSAYPSVMNYVLYSNSSLPDQLSVTNGTIWAREGKIVVGEVRSQVQCQPMKYECTFNGTTSNGFILSAPSYNVVGNAAHAPSSVVGDQVALVLDFQPLESVILTKVQQTTPLLTFATALASTIVAILAGSALLFKMLEHYAANRFGLLKSWCGYKGEPQPSGEMAKGPDHVLNPMFNGEIAQGPSHIVMWQKPQSQIQTLDLDQGTQHPVSKEQTLTNTKSVGMLRCKSASGQDSAIATTSKSDFTPNL